MTAHGSTYTVPEGNGRLLQDVSISLMMGLDLSIYQVRLDWLPLPCIALIRPSQLSWFCSSVIDHLSIKYYVVGLNPTLEKQMFRLLVLPCFDLCRSNSFQIVQAALGSTFEGTDN